MKRILILLLLISSQLLYAKELLFYEGEKEYRFHFNQEKFLIISHDCQQKCQAFLALNTITKQNVHRDGGANPGGIICVEQLDGKIKTLTDKDGDQNGFCEFGDGSLIALGSLHKTWSLLE